MSRRVKPILAKTSDKQTKGTERNGPDWTGTINKTATTTTTTTAARATCDGALNRPMYYACVCVWWYWYECVCTFWANKSQTGKQTNKLATEIGNSRMPFSITLASDQRAAADAAADVRRRKRGEELQPRRRQQMREEALQQRRQRRQHKLKLVMGNASTRCGVQHSSHMRMRMCVGVCAVSV